MIAPHLVDPDKVAVAATKTTEAVPPGVLSTLNNDGSRRWLKPKPSPGRFLNRRRAVAWGLLALFTALPWIKINGHPSILLDLSTRRFYLFGTIFTPTDTLLLALLLVGVFVTIFFFTSVLGRVWCGWGCPQTVYMEFVFRPIERFFEGTPGRAKKGLFQTTGLGTACKWIVYALLAGHLANTFLAYFVGVDNLVIWTFRSPMEHWAPFLVFAVVTALMLFDFGFFREQTCLVACPYGRFQSVLLDRNSLIVSYDRRRGEPRGRRAMNKSDGSAGGESESGTGGSAVSLPVLGDCIDCRMCVTTCPTGIDIRNGLQMECVHCTQCIDACDSIMDKVHKPRGLIRYASQASIAGQKARLIRPRPIIYAAIICIITTAFVTVLLTRHDLDAKILRQRGQVYTLAADGMVSNNVRVRLVNRTNTANTYRLSAMPLTESTGSTLASASTATLPTSDAVRIEAQEAAVTLEPGQMHSVLATLIAPASAFKNGVLYTNIHVAGEHGEARILKYKLFGPEHHGRDEYRGNHPAHDDHDRDTDSTGHHDDEPSHGKEVDTVPPSGKDHP